MAPKKRKNNDGAAGGESATAPSQLHSVTCGREEGDELLKEAAGYVDGLKEVFTTTASKADKELEQLAGEIKQLITDNGGTIEPQQTSGKMQLNVGGRVFEIAVTGLLHPKMKMTYLSTLLLHFNDQLPKDANQLPFLEMHAPYFKWLRDQLALLESRHLDEITLHSPEAGDPSYAEYHSLFITKKLGGDIQGQRWAPGASTAAAAAAAGGRGEQQDVEMADGNGGEGGREGGGEGEGSGDGVGVDEAFEKTERYMSNYRRVREGLQKQKEVMEAFLSAMRPFVKGHSSNEDIEVLTLTVCGDKVSVLRRTIAPLGPDHALVKRYNPDEWPDQEAHQTSLKFLQLVVDFGRRLVMPSGRFVHPPVVAPHEKEMFVVELGMYGLNTMPPVGEAAGASAVIKTADEWLAVMKMTDKKIATPPSLLYKGSRDTYAFPKMLECLADKSGLLFALRDGHTHRFGAFIDGEIDPPEDNTKSNLYKAPAFFFSLSGAYETPTKIEIPEERQSVAVAGTQGAVTNRNGEPCGNVYIGRGSLWLGFAQPGPAANLSSCQQWIAREHLPAGYNGATNEHGEGTLAQSLNFTCDEMEIWQVGGERLNRSDSTRRQRPREGGMCRRREEEPCCSLMDGRSV
ncbi:unnamed protein product [Vitrella brassicaformis CCMP3155]|uniref:TLDc domain-containing protein n=1 Tax=Vitrella brassicaformis (strain CCMP3155) TaxID=1169540 RepID=A0A0G4ET57_VITBC|nr:unnamed protein product [Vitrella brassicaformis CCMP3155]|eukprot:CEM01612.1 unnamed protein product [Vitrella brassicaformis CCMP3155]